MKGLKKIYQVRIKHEFENVSYGTALSVDWTYIIFENYCGTLSMKKYNSDDPSSHIIRNADWLLEERNYVDIERKIPKRIWDRIIAESVANKL